MIYQRFITCRVIEKKKKLYWIILITINITASTCTIPSSIKYILQTKCLFFFLFNFLQEILDLTPFSQLYSESSLLQKFSNSSLLYNESFCVLFPILPLFFTWLPCIPFILLFIEDTTVISSLTCLLFLSLASVCSQGQSLYAIICVLYCLLSLMESDFVFFAHLNIRPVRVSFLPTTFF